MTTMTDPRETLTAPELAADSPNVQEPAPAAAEAPDSPEAANRARADGAQLREYAAVMRVEADADVQTARAALAEAEQRQRNVTRAAEELEHLATGCDTLGRVTDHGRRIGAEALEAEARLGALLLEQAALTSKGADDEARLARLDAQREGVEASMIRAREDYDIEALTQLRAQLPALEEVAEGLRRRLAPVQARLRELGDTESKGTQLHSAAETAAALRRSHNEFLASITVRGLYDDLTLRDAMHRYLGTCIGVAEQARYAEATALLRGHTPFTALLDDALDRLPRLPDAS